MTHLENDPKIIPSVMPDSESGESAMGIGSSTITAYSQLVIRLENDLAQDGRGSSILVIPADYDRVAVEATTELAWHLAEDLGHRVILVDGSFTSLGLSRALGGANEPGMKDLMATETLSEDDVRATMRRTGHAGISFIPVGQDHRKRLTPARADTLKQFLTITSQMADFVLIQGPTVNKAGRTLAFGALVDAVLLVTLEGELPIKKLENAQQILRECGAERIGLVVGASRGHSEQG